MKKFIILAVLMIFPVSVFAHGWSAPSKWGFDATTNSIYPLGGRSVSINQTNNLTVKCTGVAATDKTAIDTALSTLSTAGGGTLVINGVCRYDSQLVMPYTDPGGGDLFTQVPIRITGPGTTDANGDWNASTATPPSGLDLRYATGAIGKIATWGLGTLEIDHITLMDKGSANTVPFIRTSNTTLNIHNVTFKGSSGTPNASNDGIVFGGSSNTPSNNTDGTAPFQGYHSSVTHCYFDQIRQAGVFLTYANAINFSYNTIAPTGGYDTGGAITITGYDSSETSNGNNFIGNLFELYQHKYAFNLSNASSNLFIGNGVYDGNGAISGQSYINFGTGSDKNLLIPGLYYAITLTAGTTAVVSNQLIIDSNESATRLGAGTAQGDCWSGTRGYTYFYKGGSGIGDLKLVCAKSSNGDYYWMPDIASYLGDDAATNGAFDADSDWTKGTHWTIGAGVATNSGSSGVEYLYQTISAATEGTMWLVTYTLTRTAGSVRPIFGVWGFDRDSSGTYTQTFIHPAGTDSILYFAAQDGFIGTIDNVIIKQILKY